MKSKQWAIVIIVVVIVVILIAVVVFGGILTPDEGFQTNGQNGNNVEIKDFAFSPSEMTVSVGDTVVWTNRDSAGHTVVSDTGNELNSALLSNGQTYSHTFTQAGTYNYHCSIHPSMTGKIIVE